MKRRKLLGSGHTTLNQVAEKVGLSISSVSRILSGRHASTSFRPETIKKVQEAANSARYRPNRLVRGIQTGRTGLIGVVVPSTGFFYGAILEGIHDEISISGKMPLVCWSSAEAGRNELDCIHSLVDMRVEGVILKPDIDSADNEYFKELTDRKIPLVTVDRALLQADCCYVGSDDEVGMARLCLHVEQTKPRAVVYFGPDTQVSTGVHRLNAFRVFFKHKPDDQRMEFLTPDWSPHFDQAIECLRKVPRGATVMAASDEFAICLYEAARKLALDIPSDVAITGYGNLPSMRNTNPSLTTVDQHPYAIGRSAAQRLLTRSKSKDGKTQHIRITPTLIVRESTRPTSE